MNERDFGGVRSCGNHLHPKGSSSLHLGAGLRAWERAYVQRDNKMGKERRKREAAWAKK